MGSVVKSQNLRFHEGGEPKLRKHKQQPVMSGKILSQKRHKQRQQSRKSTKPGSYPAADGTTACNNPFSRNMLDTSSKKLFIVPNSSDTQHEPCSRDMLHRKSPNENDACDDDDDRHSNSSDETINDDDSVNLKAAVMAWAETQNISMNRAQQQLTHLSAGGKVCGNGPAPRVPPVSRTTDKTSSPVNSNTNTESSSFLPSAAAIKTQTAAESIASPSTWSVHVTHIPYEATEWDVRYCFMAAGCSIVSVRLVYDDAPIHMTSAWTRRRRAQQQQQQQQHEHYKREGRDESQFDQIMTNKYQARVSERRRSMALNGRYFRGVAFVDLADAVSYEHALALDGHAHVKGDSGCDNDDDDDNDRRNDSRLQYHRPIRVRPTKTMSQLQDIVQRTRELVFEKIERAKLKRDQQQQDQQQQQQDALVDGRKKSHERKRSRSESRPPLQSRAGKHSKNNKTNNNINSAVAITKSIGRKQPESRMANKKQESKIEKSNNSNNNNNQHQHNRNMHNHKKRYRDENKHGHSSHSCSLPISNAGGISSNSNSRGGKSSRTTIIDDSTKVSKKERNRRAAIMIQRKRSKSS